MLFGVPIQYTRWKRVHMSHVKLDTTQGALKRQTARTGCSQQQQRAPHHTLHTRHSTWQHRSRRFFVSGRYDVIGWQPADFLSSKVILAGSKHGTLPLSALQLSQIVVVNICRWREPAFLSTVSTKVIVYFVTEFPRDLSRIYLQTLQCNVRNL